MSDIAAAPPDLAQIEAAARQPQSRGRAIDLAIRALGAGLEAPLVLELVAEGLEEDGRILDAAGLAQRLSGLAPDDPRAFIRLARLLDRLGRRRESLEAADAALRLDPGSFEAHCLAAAAHFGLSDFDAAARHAAEAARLRPQAAEPLSTQGVLAARRRDFAGARSFAQRALALDPDLPAALTTLARAELFEGQTAEACQRLQALLARTDLGPHRRGEALGLLGEARESLRQYPRAFAAFAAAGAAMAAESARTAGLSIPAAEQVRRLEAFFGPAEPHAWRDPAGEDRARPAGLLGHAFLVGFPRSGTTLLENALAGHPAIVALEESDALGRANADLFNDAAALGRLERLSEAEADACRKIYWDRVAELTAAPLAGKVLLDKMPINLIALPVIARLFPKARVLLARRDPRDVVFGCFRRRFGANVLAAEFLSLESTARFYDAVMRLADIYDRLLALKPLLVRHEDVVADFDAALARALAFLELDFDPAVRDFAERGLRARTPSATQLAGGLSARGVGAWRPYARQMAQVQPLLEPWVARFGYPPTDPALLPPRPDPAFAPTRAQLTAALAAGDWRKAFAGLDAALSAGFSDPLLVRLRGVRAQREGRPAEAAADFEAALVDDPANVGLLSALGLVLARSGRPAEALSRLDEAIALQPAFAPAHFNRGWTLEATGELAGARAAYHRAVEFEPRHAAAIGALASLAARAAQWEEARRLAAQALAIAPQLPSAGLAMAAAEAAQGEAAGAERRLRALLASGHAGPHERAVAQRTLGDVLDRLGRNEEAFAAYEAGASAMQAVHGPRFEALGVERAAAIAERLTDWFGAADPAPWRAPRRPDQPQDSQPIFVLGFPRSGTTLVGQALGLHPGLRTLDEADTLADATAAFYADDAALGRLAALEAASAAEFAELYWRRARRAGWPDDGRRLVDKLPMNTLALPIIAKLFPAAKIVFLRRDPRDVVFSCFRRQFAINPTTIDFLSLESAARLYDRAMGLFEIFARMLSLDVRIQNFEALVADFDTEAGALCAFLGLPWDPAMSGFAARAGEVATPSSVQLAGGLSAEGVGAWRPYRAHLAPILPRLAPWVERFGYRAD